MGQWLPYRDGYGATGIRAHYADFWGSAYLDKIEQKLDGRLGPYAVGHMYGVITRPPPKREPQGKQECVVVVSNNDPDFFKALLDYQILEDTGRKAELGYHTDCRVCRIFSV